MGIVQAATGNMLCCSKLLLSVATEFDGNVSTGRRFHIGAARVSKQCSRR